MAAFLLSMVLVIAVCGFLDTRLQWPTRRPGNGSDHRALCPRRRCKIGEPSGVLDALGI